MWYFITKWNLQLKQQSRFEKEAGKQVREKENNKIKLDKAEKNELVLNHLGTQYQFIPEVKIYVENFSETNTNYHYLKL